jgi:hypothetical protein
MFMDLCAAKFWRWRGEVRLKGKNSPSLDRLLNMEGKDREWRL